MQVLVIIKLGLFWQLEFMVTIFEFPQKLPLVQRFEVCYLFEMQRKYHQKSGKLRQLMKFGERTLIKHALSSQLSLRRVGTSSSWGNIEGQCRSHISRAVSPQERSWDIYTQLCQSLDGGCSQVDINFPTTLTQLADKTFVGRKTPVGKKMQTLKAGS